MKGENIILNVFCLECLGFRLMFFLFLNGIDIEYDGLLLFIGFGYLSGLVMIMDVFCVFR